MFIDNLTGGTVAPHVGAWIETRSIDYYTHKLVKSLPMWERGLKQKWKEITQSGGTVAPHVGAWIETYQH